MSNRRMAGLKKIFVMAIALLLAEAMNAAVTYRTPELKRLAGIAGVSEASLHPGPNNVRGCSVMVDDNMTVTHVGLTLFSEETKELGNRLVLEFVERYFLQLLHPAPNNSAALMLRSDGIIFSKGSFKDIRKIKPGTPFKLNYHLMRYTLSWKTKNATLSFSFPGKYQLISGDNLPQAEERLPHDIKSTTYTKRQTLKASELQPSSQMGYYIRKGAWYYAETINATTYYKKQGDGSFTPVVDASLLEESVANIMLCPAAAERYTFEITMKRYGFKDTCFDVPITQWIEYCTQKGCSIYCGIESISQEGVKATVIAANTKLNFNHLLTVTIPLKAIEQRRGTIKAELNAFIPTHNIINIKGKYKNGTMPKDRIIRNI